MLLLWSVVVVLCIAVESHGASINDVGYDTAIPPLRTPSPPYVPTPFDTTSISVESPREANLVCQEMMPLYRTAHCDILTYDNCGNIYGQPGNVSDWLVTVTNQVTGAASNHVSAVIWLTDGVARFYFTPMDVGVYRVSVDRNASSPLPTLLTPLPMTFLVVVQNTISRCTRNTVANMDPMFAQTTWAMSRANNERPASGIPGLSGLSKPTQLVTDYEWIYPDPDATVQSRIRRRPLEPRVLTPLGNPPPAADNNYKYCDVIQQG